MINSSNLRHIALIPDGNRRWARAHGLPVLAGHRRVVDKVFPVLVEKALELEIQYVTIWAFSTENWQRDRAEVDGLMDLFEEFVEKFGVWLDERDVRLAFIGRRDNLPENLLKAIDRWTAKTATNERMLVTVGFNYGGRDEILRAVNKILERREYSEVGEKTLSAHLDTSINDLPDPDLIIRPGGEKRLSGFMSWQSAYSELFFDDKMMPEWTADDLQRAVDDFAARKRRYGK